MQDEAGNSGRQSRWLKPTLLVSLALNLAFIGVIAGAALRFDGTPRFTGGPPPSGSFGRAYMMALPKEDRREIMRAVRTSNDAGLPDRAARRDMFKAVVAALEATPFDLTQLDAAVSRQAQSSIAVQSAAQGAWLAHVAAMEDAERRDYAQAINAFLDKRRVRDGKSD
ncbi:MAG: periplasmic heavy metal sensor [Roseobacter sp.]